MSGTIFVDKDSKWTPIGYITDDGIQVQAYDDFECPYDFASLGNGFSGSIGFECKVNLPRKLFPEPKFMDAFLFVLDPSYVKKIWVRLLRKEYVRKRRIKAR